jgi:hypothetical protein
VASSAELLAVLPLAAVAVKRRRDLEARKQADEEQPVSASLEPICHHH